MHLRFTLLGPGQPGVDVAVDAPSGAPLGSVLDQLGRAAGCAGPVSADGRRLPPQTTLGRPPLTTGATLRFGEPMPAPRSPATVLELRVVGGPDAGGVHPLVPGQHRLGRNLAGEVSIADPDLSRTHAVLSVRDGAVEVRDAGSTNGTTVDGRPVGAQPAALDRGAALEVGESTLRLASRDEAPAGVLADGEGHLRVNRPPRLVRPPPIEEVVVPAEPHRPDNPRFPMLAMAIPLVLGAVMVRLTHSFTFALFMLLSPVMLGANVVSDRFGGRRQHRRAQAAYLRAAAGARARADAALCAEADDRRAADPDAAAVLLTATEPRPRLWERRTGDDDALSLRLGTADLPARLTLRPEAAGQEPHHPTVPGVPVTLPLSEVGVLGLAGPPARVAGLVRYLVCQLATWHSPRQLGLVLLCAPGAGPAWRWARWLPHLRPPSDAEGDLRVGLTATQTAARVAELTARLDAGKHSSGAGRGGSGAATVVVLDGARSLRSVPGVARLLEQGPAAGIYAICLAEQPLDLPAECAATAVVRGESATRLLVSRTGHPPVHAVGDFVSADWARRVARGLAPLRDATPDPAAASLPDAVRLLDLLGGPASADRIVAGWTGGGGRGTTVLLGAGVDGAFRVDLRRDGPHVLVAGTTGAGKSELLQTLIASLAVANAPDECTFVLVDYKGGAAFADCARLPHTAGIVTDLDAHLTRRALASLDAELERRERLLRLAGRADADDYSRAGRPEGPMPRLVLVIDEFASLVAELPEFVTGLVDIARRGRSLGIHLVLATQRPRGVVSAEIRANTNLRIALRVTDPAESADVIDAPDAALISRATPGRAFCRTGAQDLAPFQCARVGGPVPPAEPAPAVRVLHWEAAGDPRAAAGADDVGGPSDLTRLVDEMRTAAAQLGRPPVASPWLAPLPDTVVLSDLAPGGTGRLALGLLDLPRQQARAPLYLDLAGGSHLLVAGGPGSGRTTVLRAVAGAIGATTSAGDVHLYAFDGAGAGLRPVAALPHTGAVVGRDEVDRGDRLLTRLAAEVGRRQEVFARAGCSSLAEQEAATGERPPWLVLLIDGWEGLVAAYDRVDAGRPVQTLLGLLSEGAAVGVRAVVTGDRSLLTGRLPALAAHRLILRMADPMDYALAGLAPQQVPARMPAGRAMVLGEPPAEAQVGLLAADPAGPAQAAGLLRLAAQATERAASPATRRRAMRVEAMPARVSYPAAAAEAPDAAAMWTLIGAGGDDLRTVGVDLDADGPAFLVAGPPRSGRSTALATMARWSVERGTAALVVAPARSPARAVAGLRAAVGPNDSAELEAALSAVDGPVVVYVDDAEALLDSPIEQVLSSLLSRAAELTCALVVAGSTDGLAATYRGLTAEVRRHRCGLLLCPSGPLDGELLGVRPSRGLPTHVGRGVLALAGQLTPVQVAT